MSGRRIPEQPHAKYALNASTNRQKQEKDYEKQNKTKAVAQKCQKQALASSLE